MPTLSLRWFFALIALFLVVAGVDVYLARTAVPVVDPSSQRIEVADFLSAARAGELSAGQVVFRPNATGLADLVATRSQGAGEGAIVRTAARLTDADLAILRESRFTENDAVSLEQARKTTGRERAATATRISVKILGLALIVTGIIFMSQRFAGRFTTFSAKTLRPVAMRQRTKSTRSWSS
jgi:hypothetical protein